MAKLTSKGTQFQITIASVLTTVAHMISIDGPDPEVQFMDLTALDSGVALEDGEVTGHTAPGSLTGEGFYDPANATHKALLAYYGAPASVACKSIYPDTAATTFNATLRKFVPKAAVGEGLKFSLEMKLKGLPTYPA
jgi:hypothetical protein